MSVLHVMLVLLAVTLGGCAHGVRVEGPRARLSRHAHAVSALDAQIQVRHLRAEPPAERFIFLGEIQLPTLVPGACDQACWAERARKVGASHVRVLPARRAAVRFRRPGDWQTPALDGRTRGFVTTARLFREARTAREAGLIHCVDLPVCVQEGRCSYRGGACRALSMRDCRHIPACRHERCSYADGACWVTRRFGYAVGG